MDKTNQYVSLQNHEKDWIIDSQQIDKLIDNDKEISKSTKIKTRKSIPTHIPLLYSPRITTLPFFPQEKPPMKLLMNPKGVQDFQAVQEHYENLMNAPTSPDVGKIVVQSPVIAASPSGKGMAREQER